MKDKLPDILTVLSLIAVLIATAWVIWDSIQKGLL